MLGIESAALLEHTEEITLARQVQRCKELEELYLELLAADKAEVPRMALAEATAAATRGAVASAGSGALRTRTGALARPTTLVDDSTSRTEEPSIGAAEGGGDGIGGTMRVQWAVAANVSVPELRAQLRAGRLARERIVASNVRLVGSAIYALKRSCGGRLDKGISESDLLQEGCISLLRAAERFDVSLGLRFSTYATFWIKAAIKRALQEQARGLAPVLVCARVAAQPSWQHAPSLA